MQRIGIRDFTVRVPRVEEWYPDGLTPEEIVRYSSREKSQAVASTQDEIVITADTMVFLDQQRLGKPKDKADALRMLTDLAGRRHTVCTGVTLRQGQRSLTRAQSTDVYFRPAGREELMAYIRGGEPMDKVIKTYSNGNLTSPVMSGVQIDGNYITLDKSNAAGGAH